MNQTETPYDNFSIRLDQSSIKILMRSSLENFEVWNVPLIMLF